MAGSIAINRCRTRALRGRGSFLRCRAARRRAEQKLSAIHRPRGRRQPREVDRSRRRHGRGRRRSGRRQQGRGVCVPALGRQLVVREADCLDGAARTSWVPRSRSTGTRSSLAHIATLLPTAPPLSYTFTRTGAAARTQTAKLTASDGAPNDGLGRLRRDRRRHDRRRRYGHVAIQLRLYLRPHGRGANETAKLNRLRRRGPTASAARSRSTATRSSPAQTWTTTAAPTGLRLYLRPHRRGGSHGDGETDRLRRRRRPTCSAFGRDRRRHDRRRRPLRRHQ